MSDFPTGWSYDWTWLIKLLRDEQFAWSEFTASAYRNASAVACGVDVTITLTATATVAPATVDTNGVTLYTINASGTGRIMVGPDGGGYGVTSGQRRPSLRVIWRPPPASANLAGAYMGFTAPLAADPLAGAYLRQVTTGNLFFVTKTDAGAEQTTDLGVPPNVNTDFRVWTSDGQTWCCDREGLTVAAHATSVVGSTTRLLPEVRVVAGGGGTADFAMDFLFFRAWRGTPPQFPLDRLTAVDIETMMLKRCILGWAEFGQKASAAARLYDHGVGIRNSLGVPSGGSLPDGRWYSGTGSGGFSSGLHHASSAQTSGQDRAVATPAQSPRMLAVCSIAVGAGTHLDAGLVSQAGAAYPKGAFFRTGPTVNQLYFVTTNVVGGTDDEVTDLGNYNSSVVHRLEVFSNDSGVTWKALVDNVLVATHSTKVPATSLELVAAADNETYADLLFWTADRLR